MILKISNLHFFNENMKKKEPILLLTLSLFSFCSYTQNINVKKSCYNYENAFTKSSYTVEAIEITNLSNEDYLSWIDFDNIYCKSQKMILNDFFYKRNGDFISRYLKYSDNSLILSNYFFPLNNQFLIRIGSGETFIYKIFITVR